MAQETRQDTQRLYGEAMGKLDDQAYDEAIALGERLKDLGFSGGFEVIALARGGQKDLPGAVAELREGVVVAPSVWLLWHLLGNYLSDLDQVDEALEAYTAALACPRSDRATIHYNRAIAFRRAGRYQEALAAADEVSSEPCLRLATGLRLALLNLLGRHEEALAAVEGRPFRGHARSPPGVPGAARQPRSNPAESVRLGAVPAASGERSRVVATMPPVRTSAIVAPVASRTRVPRRWVPATTRWTAGSSPSPRWTTAASASCKEAGAVRMV
jgi:hypothetical protein